MTTHNTSLLIDGMSVSYAGKNAIREINLDIKEGEIFGLMGTNGAGKTTMIKAILGLRDQDQGQTSIFGEEQDAFRAKERLSYLPEKFEPPWFLTGFEFLKFSMKLYKQDFSKEKMIEVAESLALDPAALGRRVHTYSKGMKQKLGLMATLLTGASLFILDEPMSGLDPMARALVKKMISAMRDKEKTIFLSSHILADMDELCDRVALLHGQTIQFVGSPAELKKQTKAENLELAFLHYIEKNIAA